MTKIVYCITYFLQVRNSEKKGHRGTDSAISASACLGPHQEDGMCLYVAVDACRQHCTWLSAAVLTCGLPYNAVAGFQG